MLEMKTMTTDEIEAVITRELPGFAFRLQHDGSSHMVVMEVQRRIEGIRLALSDVEADEPGAMNHSTREVVTRLRREATEAYGLTAYVEEREREAAAKERAAVIGALLAEIESMRPTIIVPVTIYEEDGSGDSYESHERVKDDLPPDLAVLADWARRQQR